MPNQEILPNLGGVPERFKSEGVFAYNRELVKIGDVVEALVNIQGGVPKGFQGVIKDVIVEPLGNERGFHKRIKFNGIAGEFNPKKFKKIIT
jgi:hypothetical protein